MTMTQPTPHATHGSPVMSKKPDGGTQQGTHFQAAHYGPLSQLKTYAFEHPALGRQVTGKVFVKEAVDMSSMEMSWNQLPPGADWGFWHKHKENEESYVFVRGQGQMMVDGAPIQVSEGSIVTVAPDGYRIVRNTGSEDLIFIVIQAKAGSLGQYTFEDGERGDMPIQWPQN